MRIILILSCLFGLSRAQGLDTLIVLHIFKSSHSNSSVPDESFVIDDARDRGLSFVDHV